MVNTCFTLSGLTGVMISLIFLFGLNVWSPVLLPVRQEPLYFTAFIFFTFSMVLQPLALTALLARLHIKIIFTVNVIAGITGILLVSIFSIFTDDASGIFSAMGFAITFTLILCVFWFLPRVQKGYRPLPRINLKILREIFFFLGAPAQLACAVSIK